MNKNSKNKTKKKPSFFKKLFKNVKRAFKKNYKIVFGSLALIFTIAGCSAKANNAYVKLNNNINAHQLIATPSGYTKINQTFTSRIVHGENDDGGYGYPFSQETGTGTFFGNLLGSRDYILAFSTNSAYVVDYDLIGDERRSIKSGTIGAGQSTQVEFTLNGTNYVTLFGYAQGIEFLFTNVELFYKEKLVDGTPPTFTIEHGGSTTVYNDIYNPTDTAAIQKNIKAYDIGDNKEVPVYVKTDNCKNTYNVPGNCSILFGAKDSQNNEATMTVNVIKQSFKPTLTIQAGYDYIETSYTNYINTSTLKSYFSAKTYAGVTIATSEISMNDTNYKNNSSKPSSTPYSVTASVTHNGYTVTATISIKVTDIVKPYFMVWDTINTDLKIQLDIIDFVRIAVASNDVHVVSYIIEEDTYTDNYNILGEYKHIASANLANSGEIDYNYKVVVADLSAVNNVEENPEEEEKEEKEKKPFDVVNWVKANPVPAGIGGVVVLGMSFGLVSFISKKLKGN